MMSIKWCINNTFSLRFSNNLYPSVNISLPSSKNILELLTDIQDLHILDIGCSSGYLGFQLKKILLI